MQCSLAPPRLLLDHATRDIPLSPPSPTFSDESDMLLETASEMSSTIGVEGPFSQTDAMTHGVGLSDPQYSRGRRKFLDLVNRLHSTGYEYILTCAMHRI